MQLCSECHNNPARFAEEGTHRLLCGQPCQIKGRFDELIHHSNFDTGALLPIFENVESKFDRRQLLDSILSDIDSEKQIKIMRWVLSNVQLFETRPFTLFLKVFEENLSHIFTHVDMIDIEASTQIFLLQQSAQYLQPEVLRVLLLKFQYSTEEIINSFLGRMINQRSLDPILKTIPVIAPYLEPEDQVVLSRFLGVFQLPAMPSYSANNSSLLRVMYDLIAERNKQKNKRIKI